MRLQHAQITAILAATVALSAMAAAAQAPTGARYDVVFNRPAPLASDAALLDRALSPLAAEAARRRLAHSGQVLTPQSLDLTRERFVLYVPPKPPPGGYGILVFVPPWDDPHIPPGWDSALDRAGLIYVSPVHAGNRQSVIGRREALALVAAANVAALYRVDPQRVYVSGFSGGSRVAQRLAFDYADLFRGALLDAGSDTIGGADHLPGMDLLRLAQEQSRFVLVSGENDTAATIDVGSFASLHKACVFDAVTRVTPHAGHEILDPQAFSHALDLLRRRTPADPRRLAGCRSVLERDLAAAERQAQGLIDAGRRDEARVAIQAIDRRFGGLAADTILPLADRCACGAFGD